MPAVANDLAQTTVGIIFIRGNVRRDLPWGAIRERSVRDFAVIVLEYTLGYSPMHT